MKICTKCLNEQPLDQFPKSGGQGKLSSWCRGCHHDRYAKNRKALDESLMSSVPLDPIEEINVLRVKQNITLRALGEHLGVSEVTVGKWFNRKIMPRQKNIRAMYKYFDIPLPLALKPDNDGRVPLAVDNCTACGESFPVYKAGVRFCSRACSGKDLSSRQLGYKNAMWKGGEIVTGHTGGGYIKELAPEHPNADASGYVLQHRLVMEQIIGRPLKSSERVHHKNGNRQDNRPENLELWVGTERSKKDPHGVRLVDQVVDMLSSLQQHELLLVQKALEDKLHEFYIQSS